MAVAREIPGSGVDRAGRVEDFHQTENHPNITGSGWLRGQLAHLFDRIADLDEIAMLAVEALKKAQSRCDQLRQQLEKQQAIRHDELVSLTKAVAKAVRQGANPAKSA